MTEKAKAQVIKTAFTKATILVVVIYIAVLIIDVWLHPAYKGWQVAAIAIGGMLVGMGSGFIMAFRIRFSTVMKRKTNGEMIREIREQSPRTVPSGDFGLDDKE